MNDSLPDLLGDAATVLGKAREAALLSLYASGYSREREAALDEAVKYLADRLTAKRYDTPGYRKMPDLVAELVLMAWEFPEEHDLVWDDISSGWKTDTDIRTMDGMVFLRNVVSLASDDHDMVIDDRDGIPAVRNERRGDAFPTLCPDSLYKAVSALRLSFSGSGTAATPAR